MSIDSYKPTQAPSVLIVIPTYNEAGNVVDLVATVFNSVPEVSLLFVDDNSQDGTQDQIQSCIRMYGDRVNLLARPGKQGLASAYIQGFQWGLAKGFDVFIEMDADFSHNPKFIPNFLSLLQRGHDVVVGSRYIAGGGVVNWSRWRLLISRAGSLYARTVLGIRISDLTGGFNAWKRSVLEKIQLQKLKSEGYSFQIELKYRAFKAGCKIVESPIIFEERRAGQSKMSAKIVLEAIYRVWGLRQL